jgi:hypothetical protein
MVRRYLDRLDYLLIGPPTGGAELTPGERRRLRDRALLATVDALTALGAGPAAGDRLRGAHRARAPDAGNMPAP